MDFTPRDKSLGYYLSSFRDSEPAWGWSFHTVVVLEISFGFLGNFFLWGRLSSLPIRDTDALSNM